MPNPKWELYQLASTPQPRPFSLFTVVGGVADSEQVQHTRGLVCDWLEGLDTGILRDDPDTWKDEAWPDWPRIKKTLGYFMLAR